MEEEGALPIEEEEEPTSEFVDGIELIFGRGKSGYKNVYPHRKGWQAKVAVEDKPACEAWESSRTSGVQQSRWHEQMHEACACSTAQIKLEPNLALEVRANPVLICQIFSRLLSVTCCCSTHENAQ